MLWDWWRVVRRQRKADREWAGIMAALTGEEWPR
jgi:hypothetical protein